MFYGNVQSIVAFIKNLLVILMGFYRTTVIMDKTKYIFDQNGHFNHWFSNTKAFLCSIWNLLKENFIL